MLFPTLSLMEPPGFRFSNFKKRSHFPVSILLTLTIGVFPMLSKISLCRFIFLDSFFSIVFTFIFKNLWFIKFIEIFCDWIFFGFFLFCRHEFMKDACRLLLLEARFYLDPIHKKDLSHLHWLIYNLALPSSYLNTYL